MKLSKVVFGGLAVVMSLSAGLAQATTSLGNADKTFHCDGAYLSPLSHDWTLRNCSDYIPANGQASQGQHKNELWGDAYPDKHFRTTTDGTNPHLGDMTIKHNHGKFKWRFYGTIRINGSKAWFDSPITKQIDDNDITGYVKDHNINVNKSMSKEAVDAYRAIEKKEAVEAMKLVQRCKAIDSSPYLPFQKTIIKNNLGCKV